MKTSALLKLHQRQVDVLDMIVRCNNRVATAKSDLFAITHNASRDQQSWNDFTKMPEHYKGNIKRFSAISRRLELWYCDIQERINKLSPIKTSDLEGDLLATKFFS